MIRAGVIYPVRYFLKTDQLSVTFALPVMDLPAGRERKVAFQFAGFDHAVADESSFRIQAWRIGMPGDLAITLLQQFRQKRHLVFRDVENRLQEVPCRIKSFRFFCKIT